MVHASDKRTVQPKSKYSPSGGRIVRLLVEDEQRLPLDLIPTIVDRNQHEIVLNVRPKQMARMRRVGLQPRSVSGRIPWKYVDALAGSDIQTNPPPTNQAIQDSAVVFTRQIDRLPTDEVLADIDRHVDLAKMERVLMREGIDKFAAPHELLMQIVAEKRNSLLV